MGAPLDLLRGERSLFGIVLIIAVTVFVCLGKVSFDQWSDYTLWIFGLFVGGKTITTSVDIIKTKPETKSAKAGKASKEP